MANASSRSVLPWLSLRCSACLPPDSPEIWHDLPQAAQNKQAEALQSLGVAIELSRQRLRADPKSANLATIAATDPRFLGLQNLPEFQRLIAAP
ncbi:MAG: hypothetical protein HS113_04725 [Verrucomicrobiales bacterium]|nr:hypothetical protein [Verrucomicrobiales bacterium]